MGTEKQRRNNISSLKNAFIEADRKGVGIDRDKFIASVCLDYGLTERKVKEYLTTLIRAGFIEIDEMGIWLKDKSYKDAEIAEADFLLRNGN